MKWELHLKFKEGRLGVAVGHSHKTTPNARTNSRGTRGHEGHNRRQQPPKEHKRDENKTHVNWHSVSFGTNWDVRSMRVGIMASEALRGSFRLHARARPLRIAQCPALPFCCSFFNSNQPGPSRATASFPAQWGL